MRTERPQQRRNRVRAEMKRRERIRAAFRALGSVWWPPNYGTVLNCRGNIVLFAHRDAAGWGWAAARWVGMLEASFRFEREGRETGRGMLWSVDVSMRQCEFKGDLSGVLPGDAAVYP